MSQSRGRRNFCKTVLLGSVPFLWPLDFAAFQHEAIASKYTRPGPSSTLPKRTTDLSQWITPAGHFFVRDHLEAPLISGSDWRLVIEGQVERRLDLTYQDLLRLPQLHKMVTFECAGNLPGGGMVGNAEWTGISLAALLKKSGIKPGAMEVILEGGDYGLDEGEYIPTSYNRSIPIEKALAPETLLAFAMNGKPLDVAHGFPLRAIIPGWYGMTNVKWLRRIKVTDRPYTGFYMLRRYVTGKRDSITGEIVVSPVREMGVKSEIFRPRSEEVLKCQPFTIKGAAWGGRGRVEKVEVSVDGGNTWRQAVLDKEQVPYTWVFWNYLWQAPSAGKQTIAVRAFDSQGQTQPDTEDHEQIHRYVNRWIQRVEVTVSG